MAVTNTPDVLTQATAELALTLTLAAGAAHRATPSATSARAAGRAGTPPPTGGSSSAARLSGSIGMGRIGGRYAEMVAALGADVVYAGRRPRSPRSERELGARHIAPATSCSRPRASSACTPRASAETHHLIGRRELDLIGPGGVLVNTARGSLVDSEALAAALLDGGPLGAAGLDVYENEPDVPPALLDAPRCVLLPHIGSATITSRDAMARTSPRENVIAVARGPRAAVTEFARRDPALHRGLALRRGSVRKTTSQSGEETPKP